MRLTINELVTKFTFNVEKSGLNDYENGIKKTTNTEKQAFKEKLNMYTNLFKQLDDNLAHERKIKNDIKKADLKSIEDIRKAKQQMYTEMFKQLDAQDKKDRQRSEIAFKEWNKIQENKRANLEFQEKLKEKNHQQELQGLETTKQRVSSFHSTRLQQIQKETSALKNQGEVQNKGFADVNSRLQRNTSTRLQQIQKETNAIRNQQLAEIRGIDDIRNKKRDLLRDMALTGATGLGAKNTFDNLIANPTKVAGDMQEANILLQTFGDTDKGGLKFIQKKIKEGAKIGGVMPLDIEQMVIELGKAGYKGKGSGTNNELAKMIPYIMKLSRATGGNATEAGELLTNTAASFNITSNKGYSQLTDMFVYALNESKLNFSDLSSALKLSGGAAGATAQSIPTVLANMAIARNKGITQSTIGSSGRQISLRPTSIADNIGADMRKRGKEKDKPIAKAYKALGITESDILTKGGGLDQNKLFGYLRKKFKMNDTDLEAISLDTYNGPQKKSQLAIGNIMKDLFGMTSVSMAMALLRETKRDKEIREGFSNKKYIGAADDVTKKLNDKDNFNFQAKQAEIEWYYAKQNFGKQFLPIATKLTKVLTDMAEAFANLTPKQVGFVNYAGVFVTTLLSLVSAAKIFNMIAPVLGKSWTIAFGPVSLVAFAVTDLISYLTGGPSLTGGLIGAIKSLDNYLTGGNIGKALGEAASDFVNAGDKVQFLIDRLKYLLELMGLTSKGIGVEITGKTPPSLAPNLGSKGQKFQSSNYMSSPTYGSYGSGGGGGGGGGGNIVTINQTIHANNNDAPRMAKVIKDVTKENLTMINSLRPQMVTP